MVKIITDSAADFEPSELKELSIECIPLSVCFGAEQYKENIELSKEEFFNKLKSSKEQVRTSQPSLHDIVDKFEEAEHNREGGVAIFLSSKISGTANTAKTAAEMTSCKRVFTVDSLSASAGQRLLVEYAVKLRRQGKTAAEIYRQLEKIKSKISLFACLDTVEYLHKGGRISSAVAALGTITHIKPIIRLSGGEVKLLAKGFSMRREIKNIAERLGREELNPEFPIYVMYSDNVEPAKEMAEHIKKILPGIYNIKFARIGAVVGSHIGTNACGAAFVKA